MNNPYQSSQVDPTSPAPAYGAQDLVATQTAIYNLSGAKGWVRFMSVLSYIMFAFFVIGFLGIFALSGRMGGGGALIMILVMILYCLITFFIALRLGSYASAIGRLIHSRNPMDLEAAMVSQMKFWRLSGILVLIGLVITILGLVLPLAFG